MDVNESEQIRKVIFERLVCGEDGEQLRAQLAGRLDDEQAARLVAEARERIEQERESDQFSVMARKIRRRRLVGRRYLPAKVLAGVFIFLGCLSVLSSLADHGKVAGSFTGILIGGIVLVWVEWRESLLLRPKLESADQA